MLPLCLRNAQSILSSSRPSKHLLNRTCRYDCLRSSLSYSTVTSSKSEEVTVQCRSNGSIKLNIHHPFTGSQTSPIIFYLPAGPIDTNAPPEREDHVISTLAASSNATIVRINYRLGLGALYPTPIHDVLTGYDWVLQHLAPCLAWTSRYGRRSTPSVRLGVCGELVGGSLTTMLALTECRLGESRISAAAVNNPIVDWIFPEQDSPLVSTSDLDSDELAKIPLDEWVDASLFSSLATNTAKTRKGVQTSWDLHADNPDLPAQALLHARETFFRKPSSYFDPFASPILFFRTPGVDVPPDKADADDLAPAIDGTEPAQPPPKRRKAHRTYPPTGSGLRLPDLHVSVGAESVLNDQAEELVKLVRRSVVRSKHAELNWREGEEYLADLHEEGRGGEVPSMAAQAVAEAERRVSLSVSPGVGLWSGRHSSRWRRDVEEVGLWFRRVLG